MLHTRRNTALAWIATITILVGAAAALRTRNDHGGLHACRDPRDAAGDA